LPEYLKPEKRLLTTMVHFGSLNENKVDPLIRNMKGRFPDMDFGIYPGYGILSVRLTSSNPKDIEACKAELEIEFGDLLFTDPEGKIENAVYNLFLKKGLKLAVAESCTGGQLGAKITSVSGASQYFIASIVTYSNEMKERLLGVRRETLDQYGAVSEQCVLEMAAGLLKITHADFGIAISGIAGPDGGTNDKPVGTVWVAIAKKNRSNEAFLLQLKGNRETITLWAVQKALFLLWKAAK